VEGPEVPIDCAATLPAARAGEVTPTPTPAAFEGASGDATIPSPGTVVGECYRVLGTLGTGAMGMVLLAHDERLDRRVAIKLIRPDLAWADFHERFLAEARAMARVNHPNVLHIHAFGEHEGMPYFVMELVEGRTLEEWLAMHGGRPDVAAAFRILDELCQGVAAIHAAETVHRDLKPSNVLLDVDLHPRVADLGLAVLYRGPSKPEIVGTPAYMAPEIAENLDVDAALRPRADIYSLGCIAYELFTGKRPTEGEQAVARILRRPTGPVAPPSSVRTELPASLDEVLARALAADPSERTPTVDALRRALHGVQEGSSEPDRILVAEDDEDFRLVLGAVLGKEFPDAEIELVADGRSALDAFERKRPAVVLLDLDIPTLDGIELTAILRARESSATMPIIVLTGSGGPDEWKRLSALGADRFLVKPVPLDDVVATVRRALRERAAAPTSVASR
jgi:serine/threonine-protein kinase